MKDFLTERESEVFRLLQIGMSDKEIGEKLFISHFTVKAHIRNIFKKQGVNSRKKLIASEHHLFLIMKQLLELSRRQNILFLEQDYISEEISKLIKEVGGLK